MAGFDDSNASAAIVGQLHRLLDDDCLRDLDLVRGRARSGALGPLDASVLFGVLGIWKEEAARLSRDAAEVAAADDAVAVAAEQLSAKTAEVDGVLSALAEWLPPDSGDAR